MWYSKPEAVGRSSLALAFRPACGARRSDTATDINRDSGGGLEFRASEARGGAELLRAFPEEHETQPSKEII